MQRSLDHVTALLELGRHADFSQIPLLRKKYKSYRRSELIRLGLCDENIAVAVAADVADEDACGVA